MNRTIDVSPTGTWSLSLSAAVAARSAFVDPAREEAHRTVLDLAFPLDGSWHPVVVRVVQDEQGVRAVVLANPSRVAHHEIGAQVERILCLDVDGEAFCWVGEADPVVADLQRRYPGLRPVLFPSPYQAAARAIIGHRLPVPVAAAAADRVAEQAGEALEVDGEVVHVFPSPRRLADLEPVPGLSQRKVDQLRALGAAADGGTLSAGRLLAMDGQEARAELERLAGIGPFSSELVMLRGEGERDVFPRTELSFQRAMTAAYDLPDGDVEAMEALAQRWRPYRSWVALLLRTSTRPGS